ncbi:MAG TPA: sterol desaturase family protein [Candidatus Krumholzibacteria bacterium]|nr:sterol desaturase family protein [Candidatus Krumholzibacteria bacterium]
MLHVIWDTRGYFFWLLVVSVLCLILERIRPWRRQQKLVRRQFAQDLFWLFFNGHYTGVLVASMAAFLFAWAVPAIDRARALNLIAGQPLLIQFMVFFVIKDLLEWIVHNLLHRVPWLWEFHKVHHSIEELDWIGNFRFHWMEVVVYQGLTYLPLIVLGVDGRVILVIAVVSTLIGHLNHSNVNISWGPLRYVLNSPRMHVWHHDREWPADRRFGVNFAVCFSAWDWLFGTAYWPSPEESPEQQPRRLGFQGDDRYPQSLLGRFFFPLSRVTRRPRKSFTRR